MPFTQGIRRWIVALLLMAIAIAVHFWVQSVTAGHASFLPYFPALIAAGLLAGAGPGVAALALAAVVHYIYWLAPAGLGIEGLWALATFIVTGGLALAISVFARHLLLRSRSIQQHLELAVSARQQALEASNAAELAIAEKERRWHAMFNAQPECVTVAAPDGAILEMNPSGLAMIEADSIEQVRGCSFFGLIDPRDLQDFRKLHEAALRDQPLQRSREFELVGLQGVRRVIESRSVPLHNAAGKIIAVLSVTRDISERKRAALALQHSERRERMRAAEVEALLEAVPAVVIIAHDRDCRVMTGNRLAYEMLQVPHGGNLSKSAPEQERPAFRILDRNGLEIDPALLPMHRAAATGQPVRGVQLQIALEDGQVLYLYGNAEPLHAQDGNVTGAVHAMVDVSDLIRAERQLREDGRRKDEFLATLAHELRNPIAPIRYAAATLQAPIVDSTLAKVREVIERQAAQLARLLDDLLDMSRVTRNVVELRRSLVDVRDIVEEAAESAMATMIRQQHQLSVHVCRSPLPVNGDRVRLLQIIGNLLDNAAKYTPPGGSIEIDADQDGDCALLQVIDTGIGLTSEMIPRLFELFSQLHRAGGVASGLGIGLAVVKRLVELHGGSISAMSAGTGKGARFSVRLPLATRVASEAAVPTASGANVVALHGSKPRVLIVDDNGDAAEALAVLLRTRGFQVSTAFDGVTALAAFDAVNPAVVLLDLGLPDMDGVDVARCIRARPGGACASIVAVTGWGQASDRERTRDAGIDVHLVKPVAPHVLLEKLAELLEDETESRTRDQRA